MTVVWREGDCTASSNEAPAAAPLEDAAQWIEHYRKFWDESFNRLDAYLTEVQQQNVKADDDGKAGR